MGAGWSAEGLVVLGGVDGELADELAGGCVDDADVVGEDDNACSSVLGAEAADIFAQVMKAAG